jgi:hypothetical protein
MTEPSHSAWGHPARHYGATSGEAAHSADWDEDYASDRWAEALEHASPGIRKSVEGASKQWNTVLRDHLRSETGLKISVAGDSKAVPVKVFDGMPQPFANAMREFDGLEWLLLHRPAVEAVASGTQFMERHVGTVRAAWGAAAGPSDADDIRSVRQTAIAWLKKLDEMRTMERIFDIREDVLGAYYFRIPEIRLYWVVIGIVARALSVSVEALTVVVLAHELAHAYTHLGHDIDNERWDTERFARTELDIVEGLAQFYTQIVCKRIGQRMPAALVAYRALLGKQSGPYRAHLEWVQDDEQGGEIVRVSMIECRSKGIVASSDFAEAVRRHRMGIRGRRG